MQSHNPQPKKAQLEAMKINKGDSARVKNLKKLDLAFIKIKSDSDYYYFIDRNNPGNVAGIERQDMLSEAYCHIRGQIIKGEFDFKEKTLDHVINIIKSRSTLTSFSRIRTERTRAESNLTYVELLENTTETSQQKNSKLALRFEMLRVLPKHLKSIYSLYYVKGLTTREIAAKKGVSQNAIVKKIKRVNWYAENKLRLSPIIGVNAYKTTAHGYKLTGFKGLFDNQYHTKKPDMKYKDPLLKNFKDHSTIPQPVNLASYTPQVKTVVSKFGSSEIAAMQNPAAIQNQVGASLKTACPINETKFIGPYEVMQPDKTYYETPIAWYNHVNTQGSTYQVPVSTRFWSQVAPVVSPENLIAIERYNRNRIGQHYRINQYCIDHDLDRSIFNRKSILAPVNLKTTPAKRLTVKAHYSNRFGQTLTIEIGQGVKRIDLDRTCIIERYKRSIRDLDNRRRVQNIIDQQTRNHATYNHSLTVGTKY